MTQNKSIPTAFLMRWLEIEVGWGDRPDGSSLHRSPEEYQAYLASYNASLPDTQPAEYSRPIGELLEVEISDELAQRLAKEPSLRFWPRQLDLARGLAREWRVSVSAAAKA